MADVWGSLYTSSDVASPGLRPLALELASHQPRLASSCVGTGQCWWRMQENWEGGRGRSAGMEDIPSRAGPLCLDVRRSPKDAL